MTMRVLTMFLLLVFAALPRAQAPTEKLDLGMIAKIKEEGLTRSQVMDHIGWLSDVYGPRLTGGPGILQASEWALKKFAEWGLANPHRETFPFGKGWSLVRFSAHLVEPQVQPLIGFPQEWSAGTKGPVTAGVTRVQIANDHLADIETMALKPEHQHFAAYFNSDNGRGKVRQLAHASLEHGHLRSRAARRHGAASHRHRHVRLQRRDAR